MYKEDNAKIREEILKAVEELPDDLLNTKPAADEWSPMQILDHLQLMETVIATNISKQLAKEKSEKVAKKPIQLSVSRMVKVEAPVYVIPTNEFTPLEEMKKKLAESRLLLDAVYDGTTPDILEQKSMPHPVFGKVPLVQWFPFVGLHEKRHLKQLEKTLKKIN